MVGKGEEGLGLDICSGAPSYATGFMLSTWRNEGD